jgi:dolichol kinase
LRVIHGCTKEMSHRISFELKRKAVHILLTFYPFVFIYFGIAEPIALLFSFFYLAVLLASELLRVNTRLPTPTGYLLKLVSRDLQKSNLKGGWKRYRIPYPVIGSIIALVLFNYNGWLPATIVLCFGDSASGILKAVLNKERSPWGFVAGSLVCTLLVYLATWDMAVSLLSSFLGMAGDLFSYKVDDNLTIPILAGLGAFIAKMI